MTPPRPPMRASDRSDRDDVRSEPSLVRDDGEQVSQHRQTSNKGVSSTRPYTVRCSTMASEAKTEDKKCDNGGGGGDDDEDSNDCGQWSSESSSPLLVGKEGNDGDPNNSKEVEEEKQRRQGENGGASTSVQHESFYQDAVTDMLLEQQQQPSSNATMTSALLKKIDASLKKTIDYLSKSPYHQDRGLKLLQWTLWLSSYLLASRKRGRGGSKSGSAERQQLHSQALRKLYLDMSFARYATRVWGLLPSIDAAWHDTWAVPSRRYPNASKWIGRAMAWSMIGYYPTELLAYVQWMVPAAYAKHPRSAERWSYISCRFWTLYLVAEAAQCLIRWKELNDELEQQRKLGDGTGDDGDDNSKQSKYEAQLALRNVKMQFARDALFLLPAVHWSLPNWDKSPWLPEGFVNTLMWLESVVSICQ